MLCVLIVDGMSVVVNVMLSLMSVMSPPPALCNLSVRTNVKLSEISSPRWSSVYECQSVECAFTSPVIIELGMLYCMQFVMSVSVVSMVSWCGVVLFLGAMYMLAMVMSLKCFVYILRSCISVLMTCGVLMCVNVVSDLM